MSHGLLVFIEFASLAVVILGIIDVARRPAASLASKRKALWIVGMIAGWFLFGIIGAIISVFYFVGPRRRMNSGQYSGRY
jgi:hypothetical protein